MMSSEGERGSFDERALPPLTNGGKERVSDERALPPLTNGGKREGGLVWIGLVLVLCGFWL